MPRIAREDVPLRSKDVVELASELAIAVTDQEERTNIGGVVEVHQEVARLLGDSGPVRVGRDPGQTEASGRELDKEQDVEALQEQRVDGEEVAEPARFSVYRFWASWCWVGAGSANQHFSQWLSVSSGSNQ